MSDNTLAASLTGHDDSLALYAKKWSADEAIQLWNLSPKNNIQTLLGHKKGISSLTVYETNNKTMLISGSYDTTIKLRYLDTDITMNTPQGHQGTVLSLCV